MNINKVVISVIVGCCLSSLVMEILMLNAPHIANLVTFLQFLVITLQGFIFTSKFGKVKPKIPLKQYALLVTLYFITSVLNNYVYMLHVPSTLHMIIRSASSPASMLVTWYAKEKPPKWNNAVGSILITIGVALGLYGGAELMEHEDAKLLAWCTGVVILLSTLFTGAFTGLQQEILFQKYGKYPEEMIYYTNLLPLPLFFGIYPQLRDTVVSLDIYLWFLVSINIFFQYYCLNSVHRLACNENSTTVTFILTIRKFISLLISAVIFKNNLTSTHIFGTFFVILGTCIYFNWFITMRQSNVLKRS